MVCLAVARWFAGVNHAALRRRAGGIAPVHYRPRQILTVGGMFRSLSDPQPWKDLVHGIVVSFAFRTASFSVAVSWMAASLGGLTQWFWGRLLPADNTPLASYLGPDLWLGVDPATAEGRLGLGYGVVLLILLPFITHLLAATDAAMARTLLTNENAAPARPQQGA